MTKILSDSANLDWLKKTAKQNFRAWKVEGRNGKLADAQRALARDYGFTSWRAMKRAVELLSNDASKRDTNIADDSATFLRLVGAGETAAVGAALEVRPALVNAIGPHPYWGGRPQPLHVSIESRCTDILDLLIKAGADIDGDNRFYDNWSPLMLAAKGGETGMSRKLVERGAKIGLPEALILEDDHLVERILHGTPQLLSLPLPSGSILGLARTPAAIDLLLDCGASPDGKDRWGTSAIEALSRLGPKGGPLVQRMVERGIAAEPADYARLGDKETLRALCRIDPEIARSDAVMIGAVDFGHHDMVNWLLDKGASANARSTSAARNTALHSAAWNGDLPMVELLVSHGADPSARDDEYETTPLTWAEVAVEVTKNSKCDMVASYLETVNGGSVG